MHKQEIMEKDNSSFDLKLVQESFSTCRKEDGSISLDSYIEAYDELCKFFNLFGSVFTFVVADVKDKLGILKVHRQSEAGPNFISVQSMINHEVQNKITAKRVSYSPGETTASGSRTLLRLHRALEFIILLMQKMTELKDSDKLSGVGHESYSATLSKHHTWLVRKAVGLAMYTLPTRSQLLQKMHAESTESTITLINQVVDEAQPVYDIVQTVYEENDLLSLP